MKIERLFLKNIGNFLEKSIYSLIIVFPLSDNIAHNMSVCWFSPRMVNLRAPSAQQYVNLIKSFCLKLCHCQKCIAFNTFVYLTLHIKYLAYRKRMNYREVQYYTQVVKYKKLLSVFQLKMSILSFTMLKIKDSHIYVLLATEIVLLTISIFEILD